MHCELLLRLLRWSEVVECLVVVVVEVDLRKRVFDPELQVSFEMLIADPA